MSVSDNITCRKVITNEKDYSYTFADDCTGDPGFG